MIHQFPDQTEILQVNDSDEISQARVQRLLSGSQAALRGALALRHMHALHRIALHHSHYNPNQPRVPVGHSDGGQWTRVAHVGPPPKIPPKIPKERPPTAQGRGRVIKEVAEWLVKYGEIIIEVGSWLYEYYPLFEAYLDPPKTLEELQRAVLTPKRGYDIHHIVEQTSAEQDGFPRSKIDEPDNLVRIPRLRHWHINRWYGRPNKDYGGLSPRDYLRGKDWSERVRIGLDALIRHEALKP
jgi:hypothetical protein